MNNDMLKLLAERARLMRSQHGFVDDPHVRTQSYYPAATDRAGLPIQWDAIFRLEESAEYSTQLVLALLEDLGQEITTKRIRRQADKALFARKENSKSKNSNSKAQLDMLRQAVLNHSTLACDLCEIYGQDFACLGYPWPTRCGEAACIETLPPPLQAAIRRDLGHA